MQYTLLHFLGCFPVSKSSLDQNSSRYTSQHRKRQPCHAMQIILSRPLVHPPPQPLPLVKPTTTQPEQHYFLPTEAPKFVLCFLVSLVSVSLSSAAAPALFLCFFEPPPAPDLFALVALVGVAWLEPPSLSPLRKDVERGVGARAATGVDAAVSIGVSCSYFCQPLECSKNLDSVRSMFPAQHPNTQAQKLCHKSRTQEA